MVVFAGKSFIILRPGGNGILLALVARAIRRDAADHSAAGPRWKT
jgi:hypothetical protein